MNKPASKYEYSAKLDDAGEPILGAWDLWIQEWDYKTRGYVRRHLALYTHVNETYMQGLIKTITPKESIVPKKSNFPTGRANKAGPSRR